MRSMKIFAGILSAGILLMACNAGKLNDKAATTATAFYTNLQKKAYDSVLQYCSDKAFGDDSPEEWKRLLKRNSILLGELKSFTKTSDFNIQTSTSNGTTVAMAYDVQYQYGKSKDSLYFVKGNDGSMKVYRYTWKHKEAAYITTLSESEKQAIQYMEDVKTNNYDAAVALCSEEALKATPKPEWIAFLQSAGDKIGPLAAYSVIKDSSTYNIEGSGESGKGNYYDIWMQSERGANKVMEKIVFFQKNFDEPIKLAGHNFK